MKRHGSFSLKNVLAIQFIVVAVASVMMTILFLFFLAAPELRKKNLAIIRMPLQIEHLLDKQTALLRDISDFIKDRQDIPLIHTQQYDGQAIKHGFFEAIYLLNKKGQIIPLFQQYNPPEKNTKSENTAEIATRILTPDRNHTGAFWSDSFISPITGKPSSACVIPSAGHILVGEISAARLSQILKEQDTAGASWIVLDKNHYMIGASHEMLNTAFFSQGRRPLCLLAEMEKPGLHRLCDLDIYGIKAGLHNTSWSVFTALPDNSLAENIRLYAPFFFLCIAASLVLALLSALYFSRSLSRRILLYTKKTREIARGFYSAVPENEPIREMADFSQNLQKMSLTVQEKENGYAKAMTNYLDIVRTIENIIVVLDKNLVIKQVNEASENIFALPQKECIGQSFLRFVPLDNIEATKERHARWVEQGLESVNSENTIIDNLGKCHVVFWHITLNYDERGDFTGFTGFGHEFSAWKTMQEELQLAALVYQKSAEAMIVMNEKDRIISVNPAFETITGYASEEVLFKNPARPGSVLHDRLFYENIRNAPDTPDHWQGEVWNRRKNGELYAARLIIHTIRTSAGKTYRRIVLFSDITEQKFIEKITWQQNYLDRLTGLPNRNFLKQELSRAKKINMPVALMFLDPGEFRHINEAPGRLARDMLLQETARRLKACIHETDAVMYLGGDKFAILLRGTSHPEKIEHIGKILFSGLSSPLFLNNAIIHVSPYINVTFYPDDAVSTDDLLKNAAMAINAAKQEGEKSLLHFTRSMQKMARARIQLIDDLRQAMAGRQFEIMYQPIAEIETGLIHKAEALVRWRHPVKGMINPAEFISITEDTGMMAFFGNWMFHEAASQVHIWRKRFHPDFQISINISPLQFKNGEIDFINWLSHLQELRLPGSGMIIEITESLLTQENGQTKKLLATFRNAGMQIALDDFGAGDLSLSCLQNLNFDYLGIDPSFTRNLSLNDDTRKLCEAIIVMAHKRHLKVIAKGIETIQQREILVGAACDFGQGDLYSTPLPPAEFEQILENNHAMFNLDIRADIA